MTTLDVILTAFWATSGIAGAILLLRARALYARAQRLADRVMERTIAPRCGYVALRGSVAPATTPAALANGGTPETGLVYCARHAGHNPPHMVTPAEVLAAGYTIAPF